MPGGCSIFNHYSKKRLVVLFLAVVSALLLLTGFINQDSSTRPLLPHPEPAFKINDDSGVLSLISWNVHGAPSSSPLKDRVSTIASLLKNFSPDVVLLQEVFKSSDKQLFFEQLGEQYDFIDTESMIREPNHILIGGLLGDRKSGLITLLKKSSRWKLIQGPDSPRFYEFTSHPEWIPYIWQGDRLANKGVLQVTIEKGEEQIMLFNTHLQANYGSQGEHHEIRTQQIMEVLALTYSISKDIPIIFAGDINVKPVCMDGSTLCADVENYNLLTNNLLDLTTTLRESEKCQNSYLHAQLEDPDCFTRIREVGSTWIDYVFISPDYGERVTHQLQILNNAAPDYPYSDHNGLYLALYE